MSIRVEHGDCIAVLPGLSRYRFMADGEIVSYFGLAPRVLKGGADKDGYRRFVLIADDGKHRYIRRATAQCEAWHGCRPAGHAVRHLDGTRTNDAPANLAWGTPAENCRDKIAHGTAQRGEKCSLSKISEASARAILADSGKFKAREIAAKHGCTLSATRAVLQRRSWRWLDEVSL